MLPGQRPQLSGQGEGDQEIAARHQSLRLSLNPLLALKVLAVRTIAMAARVRHEALLLTAAALRQHARAQGRSAALHSAQGLAVAGQNGALVLRQVGRLKTLDDGGQRDHLTVPQSTVKRLIKASMRALA